MCICTQSCSGYASGLKVTNCVDWLRFGSLRVGVAGLIGYSKEYEWRLGFVG